MDDRKIRQMFLYYIKLHTEDLNPTFRNSKLGVMQRLFDQITAEQLPGYLPSTFFKHLAKLPEAIEYDYIHLWALELALKISTFLVDPVSHELRRDVLEAIGLDNVDKMRRIGGKTKSYAFELDHAVCNALKSVILQYLYKNGVQKTIIDQINRRLDNVDYMDASQIHDFRKACLRDRLKLDKYNHKHLEYWQDRTELGPLKKGGQPVLYGYSEYRVPHRVQKMFETVASHHGSYSDLVYCLNEIRSTPLGWFPCMKQKYRHDDTKDLYRANDLEKLLFTDPAADQLLDGSADERDALITDKHFNIQGLR